MKKTAIAVTLLITLLLFATLAASVSAARTVGVNVNDKATYSYFFAGNTTAGGFNTTTIPSFVEVTVTEISGTNVTFSTLITYPNGTQETSVSSVDVETGQGNSGGNIIAANLNAGDLIYTGSWSHTGATINETVTRNYLGSNVQTNHLSLVQHEADSTTNMSMTMDFFWLRSSGMMAEATINTTTVQTGYYSSQYESLTISGLTIPEFPARLILPLFLVLSIFVLVTARKKLFKTSTRQNTNLPSFLSSLF